MTAIEAAEEWIKENRYTPAGDQLQALAKLITQTWDSAVMATQSAIKSRVDHTEMDIEYRHEDTGKLLDWDFVDTCDPHQIDILRTSEQWMKDKEFSGTVIRDADGWDRLNFQYSFYEELITRDDMLRRIARSTIKIS